MRAILDREDIPAIRTYVADKAAAILEAANGEIEAVNGLTRAVPIALVQDCSALPTATRRSCCDWSYWNQMDAFRNQPFDAASIPNPANIVAEREAANAAMRTYLIALVQRRAGELQAGQGGNDPVSRLLAAGAVEGGCSSMPPRVVLNAGGLLIGAVETTSHAVINALAGLMERPDVLPQARAAAAGDDPAAFDGFVFEALRFKPAFPYFFRICEQETVLQRDTDHATEVSRARRCSPSTHSAMFDAAAFAQPDRFDPNRRPATNSTSALACTNASAARSAR